MNQRKTANFNLKQIADSGQCFRLMPCPESPDTFHIISCGKYLEISQNRDMINFICDEKDILFWEHYFDLDTDYSSMISSILPQDSYLIQAAQYGNGIRILRQDPWEMIITFILSQQKTIPAIRSLVEALSARYGTILSIPTQEANPMYAFPTPEQLYQASLEDLLDLKLGYRAKYVRRICVDVCVGALNLDELHKLNYLEAMEYLQQFYGIGEKVANCVCLYGLHHIEAFPVDTWIKKILMKEYAPGYHPAKQVPPSRLCDALVQEYFSKYNGYAGVMQQYMFYYERSISQARRSAV